MKEILEDVYSANQQDNIRDVFHMVLDHSGPYQASPTGRGDVRRNTSLLQAQAFEALVTYNLSQEQKESDNAWTFDDLNACTAPDLSAHTVALGTLRSYLLDFDSWYPDPGLQGGSDPMKWATVLINVSRAIDLYIALENAYLHYGGNTTWLLSRRAG